MMDVRHYFKEAKEVPQQKSVEINAANTSHRCRMRVTEMALLLGQHRTNVLDYVQSLFIE